jgi:hypothetical protein
MDKMGKKHSLLKNFLYFVEWDDKESFPLQKRCEIRRSPLAPALCDCS